MRKRLLSFGMAVIMVFGIIAGVGLTQQTEVYAAQKVITMKPTECKDVTKILPKATKHYATDSTSDNYSYVFKITLTEASKLRITGLARYSFWAWGGKMNYKLTNSLTSEKATYIETWDTYVYSDHTWEQQLGNYCDKLFTLNKGTYYLFVNTDLKPNWRNETYNGASIYDYPSGLWLSVNKTIYTKTPTLKTVKNSKASKVQVKYSKVNKATGYQIQYSTSRKFSGSKSVTSKGVSTTLSKLKKGKTYYIRVRAYRTSGESRYYGAWSNVKSVKIKK